MERSEFESLYEHMYLLFSFLIQVKTANLRRDLKKLKAHFDFSNYDKNDSLFSQESKNTIGLFKDELQGNTLEQFVGLRSKAYAMQIRSKHGRKVKIKCKGIAKSYRDRIEFEKYLACITHTAKIRTQVRSIRARNNLLKIIHQNKTAVSSFDDKR